FVTADMHWLFYRETREGLRMLLERPGVRDQIVVAVVAYVAQPEFLWVPFDEVMIELPELGRIDATIAGGCYGYEIARRLPVYERHRATQFRGVRGIGASFHDRPAAVEHVERG